MSRRPLKFEELPLFASDEAIAAALLGPGKIGDWRQISSLLERRGLPKIDALMGGRYTPAIKAFFDEEYRLTGTSPLTLVDGPEELGSCSAKAGRRKIVRV